MPRNITPRPRPGDTFCPVPGCGGCLLDTSHKWPASLHLSCVKCQKCGQSWFHRIRRGAYRRR